MTWEWLMEWLGDPAVGVVLVLGGLALLGYRLQDLAQEALAAAWSDQDGGPKR